MHINIKLEYSPLFNIYSSGRWLKQNTRIKDIPRNNGRRPMYHSVRYSESPLYILVDFSTYKELNNSACKELNNRQVRVNSRIPTHHMVILTVTADPLLHIMAGVGKIRNKTKNKQKPHPQINKSFVLVPFKLACFLFCCDSPPTLAMLVK